MREIEQEGDGATDMRTVWLPPKLPTILTTYTQILVVLLLLSYYNFIAIFIDIIVHKPFQRPMIHPSRKPY